MCQSNEREMYLLSSKFPIYSKHIEQAKEYLKDAMHNSNNMSLSFSGGKDSIVLLDLAVKCGFNGTLLFFKYGICDDVETPKENIELLKYYANMYNLRYYIAECLGEIDCWEQCGRFTFIPESDNEKRIFNKTNYDFQSKSAEFERTNNIDLSIIGMRKDESKNRRFVLNKRGAIYRTQNRGSITCCPLMNFSDEDIWAYIFNNNLKYLSVYDYPNIDRRKIRNEITMLYNFNIMRNGMMWHYQQMYPEYFNYIKKKWGDCYSG